MELFKNIYLIWINITSCKITSFDWISCVTLIKQPGYSN